MNRQQVRQFVMHYLKSTQCQFLAQGDDYVQVRLSPEADKAITGRPYYWSFIERTGAEPEPMTMVFFFNQIETPGSANNGTIKPAENPEFQQLQGHKERITYGSARLAQIMQAAAAAGKYVQMYELPIETQFAPYQSAAYTSWLAVNYKIEFRCDMKRDELHSLGISLSTGEIMEDFHPLLLTKSLIPKLPANTFIKQTITLRRAMKELETYLEQQIRHIDHHWAEEAVQRMEAERDRVQPYYEELSKAAMDEKEKQEITAQGEKRLAEIKWQYEPRIQVNVINCGIFHLFPDGAHIK